MNISNEQFSRKVFIGGLPVDVKEVDLKRQFKKYGSFYVEWDPRSQKTSYGNIFKMSENKGFAFLVFTEESSVNHLINEKCFRQGDRYYTLFSTRTVKDKTIQVRPWRHSDARYILDSALPANPLHTIFLGAIPRQIKANELAFLVERMYGTVIYVEIEVESTMGYPKGAARIIFAHYQSFVRAMVGRYVDIPNTKGTKRLEIKPYVVDDQPCDNCHGVMCHGRPSSFFCADIGCLQYYCEPCWSHLHYAPSAGLNRMLHKPHQKIMNNK